MLAAISQNDSTGTRGPSFMASIKRRTTFGVLPMRGTVDKDEGRITGGEDESRMGEAGGVRAGEPSPVA